MKRFKQFLLERLEDDVEKVNSPVPQKEKQSLPPSRKDYTDTEEGNEKWKSDVKSWAAKEKAAATIMTTNAKSAANTLGKIETGLKVADVVAAVADKSTSTHYFVAQLFVANLFSISRGPFWSSSSSHAYKKTRKD